MKTAKDGAPLALMLLSPSCGGKHTVTSILSERTIAELVIRDTTREPRPSDNGTNRCVSRIEFGSRASRLEYVSQIACGNGVFYGHRPDDIIDVWDRGMVPALRGLPDNGSRSVQHKLAKLRPGSSMVTVYMITDPPDIWQESLRARNPGCDVEDRIRESLRQEILALKTHRSHIDHVVTNAWSRPEEAAARIEEILRAV